MLENREARAARQREALFVGTGCIVSFSLNIPGPVKTGALIEKAFSEGEAALMAAFGASLVPFSRQTEATGCEGLYLVSAAPEEAKQKTVAIEESHPLGRLFDMDVVTENGALSRPLPRRCLLCGREAKICARSRAHGVPALQEGVAVLLEGYFAEKAAEKMADRAAAAMRFEVSLTPKPGLVDLNDSGAHTDMDAQTFFQSTEALYPWLKKLYLTGRAHGEEGDEALFARLRTLGRGAEEAMLRATGGVNTHKGLLFSLALLLGAAGRLQAGTDRALSAAEQTAEAAKLARYALRDFSDAQLGQSYRLYGVTGARGEAANGFPTVLSYGLPVWNETLAQGGSASFAASKTLLSLMAHTEDANIVRRAGKAEAERRRAQAKEILSILTGENRKPVLTGLNAEYIEKNISPGGAADLLVLTMVLGKAVTTDNSDL